MQDFNVYHRNEDGSLGKFYVESTTFHKEAILTVQEVLVEAGDCLTKKAILTVIPGGVNAQ